MTRKWSRQRLLEVALDGYIIWGGLLDQVQIQFGVPSSEVGWD